MIRRGLLNPIPVLIIINPVTVLRPEPSVTQESAIHSNSLRMRMRMST